MSIPYDIFIPIAPKDYNKLKFLLKSIEENLSGYEGIYITSPDNKVLNFINYKNENEYYFTDKQILNLDILKCKYRPGWQYQMFLKMFQNITKNDYYLTIDSDIIFNKPLSLFEDGKPIMYVGWEQHHRPYFEYQEKLFNLPRIYPHTFICDMNFFNKNVWKMFLDYYNYTPYTLWDKTCEISNENCRPAEPEIYGQYVWKQYSGMYIIKQLNFFTEGRLNNNCETLPWSDLDYQNFINRGKQSGMDLTAAHSWNNVNIYNWI